MSDFVPGFSARHDAAAQALAQAFAVPEPGFAAADIRARAGGGPRSFSPQAGGPRHFSPADPDSNPTEGWDPFDPAPQPAQQPFVDPVAAAHAAGYAEGLAAALAETAAEGSRDRALLEELLGSIATTARFDREAVAQQLRQTVLLLVTKLVGETGVSAGLLASRIETAAELLADSAESALLRLHPEDIVLVEGRLPKSLFAIGDAHIARGSFVLESASTIVEDGPEIWLEQLAQAVDRVAVPA